MSKSLLAKVCSRAVPCAAAVAVAVALPSCGGGGGGINNATLRPKTLDNLVLTVDNQFVFRFFRTPGTPAALTNGDIESGIFLFSTPTSGSLVPADSTLVEDVRGAATSLTFPSDAQSVGYTYEATNNSSGVIRITAFDLNNTQLSPLPNTVFGVNPGEVPNDVDISIVFNSDGAIVSVENVIFRSSTIEPGVVLDAGILTSGGGPVVENYNPEVDPNRPSEIVPEDLSGGTNFFCTHGIDPVVNIPSQDFVLVFSPDAGYVPALPTDPDDQGEFQLTVFDPMSGLVDAEVTAAGLYTWKRIGGTDTATLVLSNIPDDPALPFDTELNGTYTFSFLGDDNGEYIGVDDDRSGTFLFRAP